MMKKFAVLLCCLALVFGIVGNAAAISFTNPSGSVSINNVTSLGWTSLTPNIVLSDGFDLNTNGSIEIDFFTLTATGFGLGSADISATLTFESPQISASGNGDVGWATTFGTISGGYLFWSNATLPNLFDIEGTLLGIDFEEGLQIVCGQTATVHAYITNYGNGTVSVPEPETMLMLGFVLLGLVGVSRKRFKQRN